MLLEKMSIITQLQQTSKQLVEEKQELQAKLNQLLRQYGKVIAPPQPVTAVTEPVRVAPPPTRDIGLNGRVTALDLENSLAEISIGSANGVKTEMKFHVTRGDKFICDILILDVAPERSIGILERIQENPKVGDSAGTNL